MINLKRSAYSAAISGCSLNMRDAIVSRSSLSSTPASRLRLRYASKTRPDKSITSRMRGSARARRASIIKERYPCAASVAYSLYSDVPNARLGTGNALNSSKTCSGDGSAPCCCASSSPSSARAVPSRNASRVFPGFWASHTAVISPAKDAMRAISLRGDAADGAGTMDAIPSGLDCAATTMSRTMPSTLAADIDPA